MPKLEKCHVHECGAVVLRLQVGGETVAVNPEPDPVIVEEAGQVWRRAFGYRPHSTTCVDIQGRLRKGRRPGGEAR